MMRQQLKSLIVLSDVWDKEDEMFSAEIADCLQRRAAGGSRLQELCVILRYYSPEVCGVKALENEQRSTVYRQRLQPLVDKLKLRFEYVNKL
ncbi:hypothetical protein C8Q80DRAFT_1208033 [Daedaleopsis nitida]|nr:hypothetical protein C8Q80DRAFT_1208033 [Daedaleopsis nitida]